MIKYEYKHNAYVADDGSYGVTSIVTFDYEDLHAEYPKVWEILDEIHDSERTDFILAVLDQDEEMLRDLSEAYGFDLNSVLE